MFEWFTFTIRSTNFGTRTRTSSSRSWSRIGRRTYTTQQSNEECPNLIRFGTLIGTTRYGRHKLYQFHDTLNSTVTRISTITTIIGFGC